MVGLVVELNMFNINKVDHSLLLLHNNRKHGVFELNFQIHLNSQFLYEFKGTRAECITRCVHIQVTKFSMFHV